MKPLRVLTQAVFLAVTLYTLPASAQTAASRIDAVIARDERPDAATAKPIAEAGALLLDVRSVGEWDAGHAKSAIHIPWTQVDAEAGTRLPDKNAPVIVYCAVGARAWWGARTLRGLGYTRVVAVSGGYADMVKAGYATETVSRPAKKPS